MGCGRNLPPKAAPPPGRRVTINKNIQERY